MDPIHIGEEHRMLREQVRRFVETEVVPNGPAWEKAGQVPRDFHRKMAALGLLGIRVPTQYGGSGLDARASVVMAEELAQEAQLVAYSKLAEFKPGYPFAAWVHGIARNLCANAIAKRREMLAEHGIMGRDYPDVRANTVSSFALGDYEWLLAFECDELERIVDVMRHLRGAKARAHTREELPFLTGIRKPLAEIAAALG